MSNMAVPKDILSAQITCVFFSDAESEELTSYHRKR